MTSERDMKKAYRTRAEGDFPEVFDLLGRGYRKLEDLRYGSNPHQPAALYRPALDGPLVLGAYQLLKSGKGGLSQLNVEDMHQALGILKYLGSPACCVMKHGNPSGVAMQGAAQSLAEVYRRARDADAQAAFGSAVVLNRPLDAATAQELMQSVVEVVAAPGYDADALDLLRDSRRFGRNRQLRVVQVPEPTSLPRFVGDATTARELKVFDDGSLVVAEPFLSRVRTGSDLVSAYAEHRKRGRVEIGRSPSPRELEDLLFAWYVSFRVRSNACVIVKNGQTLGVGTGQQDRVGAVELALAKVRQKYRGEETLEGAVMSSDGYFPFRDAVDIATAAGVRAFVQPGGSVNDHEAVQACNEAGATMVFALERCFSHH